MSHEIAYENLQLYNTWYSILHNSAISNTDKHK